MSKLLTKEDIKNILHELISHDKKRKNNQQVNDDLKSKVKN